MRGGRNVVVNNTRPKMLALNTSLGPMPANPNALKANEYRKLKGTWET